MRLSARSTFIVALCGLAFALTACEKKEPVDPDAPKSPEWESCIADVAAYAECQNREAKQLGEGIQKRIAKQMDAKIRQSGVNEGRCQKVLSKIPADDGCAPD